MWSRIQEGQEDYGSYAITQHVSSEMDDYLTIWTKMRASPFVSNATNKQINI